MKEITKVCLLGAGVMATGITELLARKNIHVLVWNRRDPGRVPDSIARSLEEKATRGEVSPGTGQKILSHISITDNMADLQDQDAVIECIGEDLPAKQHLFKQISRNGDYRFIATNTSSLAVSRIAKNLACPEKVIGLHFFNPPVRLNFAEIIHHPKNSSQVIAECRNFCDQLDFTYILVPDKTGSVVNRILCAMLSEAARIYSGNRKYLSHSDIDAAMREGAAHSIGPFALADFIGNDICAVMLQQFNRRFPGNTFLPGRVWKRTPGRGKRILQLQMKLTGKSIKFSGGIYE